METEKSKGGVNSGKIVEILGPKARLGIEIKVKVEINACLEERQHNIFVGGGKARKRCKNMSHWGE